ncbi:MAG: transcription initiation factor IIB [Candidatus Verstraetearchaeota archaeon]|nr:transcription initiation factor IIB [Candidatus Verstraetearchaeota archaeon]
MSSSLAEKREPRKEVEDTTPNRCPECGGTLFIHNYERGEVVCANCGLVVSERVIDQGPEWRAFTPEEREKRSRVGSPLSPAVHDRGLSTVIDWRDKDAMGRRLEPRKRIEILRWRKWQIRTRVHSSLDRNLAQAMSELDRISSQLGLPRSVKDEAAVIYRRAVEKGLVRGRSIESVMAAAIYAACRELKIPRTLDEIAKYTKSGRKDVARCYRLLLREVSIRVPIADPLDFISRIGGTLGLSGVTQHRAAEIIKEAKRLGITAGKDPAGLAAAAIYIASLLENERKTQKEIAQAAQVTEVTVRNRYKELIRTLKIEVPAQ